MPHALHLVPSRFRTWKARLWMLGIGIQPVRQGQLGAPKALTA